MPNRSPISNKRQICLVIDAEKAEWCKKNNVNISLLLDAALERETNPAAHEAFAQAQARQNQKLKEFIEDKGIAKAYDDYRYGGDTDVVEKEPQRETKSSVGSFTSL